MSIATKCTCGYSITGVCTSSVKECRQLRKENTQLPKEVVEEINEQADKYGFVVPYNDSNKFYNDDKLEGYKAGATAYAIKLHQANETIKELERQNEKDYELFLMKPQAVLDESAAGRESDRNEFAEWCRVQPNYGFVRGMGWMCSITHEYFTTDFMYELFKQQKEK